MFAFDPVETFSTSRKKKRSFEQLVYQNGQTYNKIACYQTTGKLMTT